MEYALKGHIDCLLRSKDVTFVEEYVGESIPAVSIGGVEFNLRERGVRFYLEHLQQLSPRWV